MDPLAGMFTKIATSVRLLTISSTFHKVGLWRNKSKFVFSLPEV